MSFKKEAYEPEAPQLTQLVNDTFGVKLFARLGCLSKLSSTHLHKNEDAEGEYNEVIEA